MTTGSWEKEEADPFVALHGAALHLGVSGDLLCNAFAFALLNERFASIDYEQAKQDVLPFIKDKSKLNLWSSIFLRIFPRHSGWFNSK